MTLHEYDVVRLRHALPQHGLEAGAVGAIVMVFDSPRAYEVEFCDSEGSTLALVQLEEAALEKVGS